MCLFFFFEFKLKVLLMDWNGWIATRMTNWNLFVITVLKKSNFSCRELFICEKKIVNVLFYSVECSIAFINLFRFTNQACLCVTNLNVSILISQIVIMLLVFIFMFQTFFVAYVQCDGVQIFLHWTNFRWKSKETNAILWKFIVSTKIH